MKSCKQCGVEKVETDFRLRNDGKLNLVCKACISAHNKARSKAPAFKERRKFDHILLRYGLTKEKWEAFYKSQGGKCAICCKPFGRAFTDHNHATGEVRGLLCGPCNMYIGHIRETAEVLQRALDYLKTKVV